MQKIVPKKESFKKDFLKTLNENLYVSPENRNFLMRNFDNLPISVLNNVFDKLSSQNNTTSKYIAVAINEDPSILDQMKKSKKEIKKKIVDMTQSEEESLAEDTLESQLDNI